MKKRVINIQSTIDLLNLVHTMNKISPTIQDMLQSKSSNHRPAVDLLNMYEKIYQAKLTQLTCLT